MLAELGDNLSRNLIALGIQKYQARELSDDAADAVRTAQ